MFGTFAGFSLGLTATKFIALYRKRDPLRAGRIISLVSLLSWTTGTIGTIAMLLSAHYLATRTLSSPTLDGPIKISAFLILFGSVNGVQTGILYGFESFKSISVINIITGLANLCFTTSACFVFGLNGALIGSELALLTTYFCNYTVLVKECNQQHIPVRCGGGFTEFAGLWPFSLSATLAGLLVAPTLWICQALLVKHSSSFQGVAEYSIGMQWRSFLQFFPSLICSAYLPVAASISQENTHRKRKFLIFNLLFSSAIATTIGIALMLASPIILNLYGAQFQNARVVFTLMLVAGIIDSASIIVTQALIVADRIWIRLLTNCVWAATILGLSLVLIPTHGAIGLAVSTCTAYATHLILQTLIAFKNVK